MSRSGLFFLHSSVYLICPPSILFPLSDQVSPVPCHGRHRFSCKRPCGRPLTCGNHTCKRECHLIDGGDQVMSVLGSYLKNDDMNCVLMSWTQPLCLSLWSVLQCDTCEEGCSKPRPPGCPHTCLCPCHPGNCPPCSQMIRQRCHCRITMLYLECTSVFTGCCQAVASMLQKRL